MNMLSLVPDFVKLPVAVVIGGLLIFYPASWYGASQEKSRNEVKTLTKTIEVIRDRAATEDQVAASDAATMCASLGLSKDAARECVRRMEEANTVLANVGNDTQNGSTICGPGSSSQRVRSQTGLLVPTIPPVGGTAHR